MSQVDRKKLAKTKHPHALDSLEVSLPRCISQCVDTMEITSNLPMFLFKPLLIVISEVNGGRHNLRIEFVTSCVKLYSDHFCEADDPSCSREAVLSSCCS